MTMVVKGQINLHYQSHELFFIVSCYEITSSTVSAETSLRQL